MQVLAYGGEKPLPFQRAICESQALEPGITGNFTINSMVKVVDKVGCNPTNASIHAPEVIDCLRNKDTQCLFDASAATLVANGGNNLGDVWLPAVDGDFLPDAPSKLIAENRFGNVSLMLGWTQNDVNPFTNISISDAKDTLDFIAGYIPGMPREVLQPQWDETLDIMELYPENDFVPPPGTNLTANFYRSSTILRDILMICEPLYLAKAMFNKGGDVYMYNWNQTLLDPIIESVQNLSGMGVVHTSEFAYIYADLAHYNVSDYPFNPTQADYDLLNRASKTWIDFAYYGTTWEERYPGADPNSGGGLKGWRQAFWRPGDVNSAPKSGFPYVFTIGGPQEGLFPLAGPDSPPQISSQKLVERCDYFNDPTIIQYLGY
jgi:carboxylesterase type B